MPGFQELVVILVVAALVLGPHRLPKLAADAARLLARFRREANAALTDLKRQADVEGLGDDLRGLRREVRDTRSLADRAVRAELRTLTDRPSEPHRPLHPVDGDGAASGLPTDGGHPTDDRNTIEDDTPKEGTG
jgi:sec-independent protein translocase protein TatB